MVTATIRYWAAAKQAAGRAEEHYEADTLETVLAAVRDRHAGNESLLTVLERSSFLVDEVPVGQRAHERVKLAEGATIEVLPPFAGG